MKKSALKPAPLSPLVVRILDHEEDTDIENEGDSSDSIPSISELELQAKRERTINTRKRSRPRRGTAVEEAAKVEEPPTKVLRGRGRPPKSSAETVNGKAVKTSKLNSANTADAQAEEHDSTPSRGSRAAAQSAKLSIANQSVSIQKLMPIFVVTQAVQIKRKKRATATFSSTASTVSSKRPKTQGAAAKTRGRPKQTLYEVEKIVGRKDNAVGTKLYLVKWVNYPSSENTWEPLAHLDGCLGLVHAFDQKQAKSTASKNTNKKKAK